MEEKQASDKLEAKLENIAFRAHRSYLLQLVRSSTCRFPVFYQSFSAMYSSRLAAETIV